MQLWSETQRPLLAKRKTSPSVVSLPVVWNLSQQVHECSINNIPLCVSGVCQCSDFTTGMTCERCLDGFYGNALIGTPGDCQPCPCPDRSSCAQIAETGQVVCTNCPTGQTGDVDSQWFKIICTNSKRSEYWALCQHHSNESVSTRQHDAKKTAVHLLGLSFSQWTSVLHTHLM